MAWAEPTPPSTPAASLLVHAVAAAGLRLPPPQHLLEVRSPLRSPCGHGRVSLPRRRLAFVRLRRLLPVLSLGGAGTDTWAAQAPAGWHPRRAPPQPLGNCGLDRPAPRPLATCGTGCPEKGGRRR